MPITSSLSFSLSRGLEAQLGTRCLEIGLIPHQRLGGGEGGGSKPAAVDAMWVDAITMRSCRLTVVLHDEAVLISADVGVR